MTNQIKETTDFEQIRAEMKRADQNSLIFFDVDDTIITPKSNLFRPHSKYYHLIDDIKKHIDTIPNYREIISNWRLQRKIVLVDNRWPEFIKSLNLANKNVYAITAMRSGSFGAIDNLEDWRYRELKSAGVMFNGEFLGSDYIEALPADLASKIDTPAVFYKGFFMTGLYSKGSVMRYILENQPASKVFFVDDREDHVKDVGKVCAEFGLSYSGFIYRGIDLMKSRSPDYLMEFQKQKLMEESTWYEDEEAAEMLKDAK